MTIALPAKITPEELLQMSEGKSFELVDGNLVERNVSVLSSQAEARISHVIERFLEGHPGAAVFASSLGYRCFPDDPGRIRRPDVTVIRIERLAALEDLNPGFMPIIPDLAIEVVSTSDTINELDEKLEEYRLAGFPLIWVADPVARLLTIYPNPGKPRILTADDTVDAPNALPGFSCVVAELFPRPLA